MGGTIPAGWQVKTLGMFKWGSGGTPSSGVSEYYGGEIPWVIIRDLNDTVVTETATRITEAGLKNSSAKWVEPGSVLIALYGSIGKAAIAGIRLTTNQAIAFTKPDPVNAKYLFYYLKYSQRALLSLGKGATQQNISQSVLKTFPFVLAPKKIQEKIVLKIEELFSDLDAGIAALKRAQANLKRYRAAVLKAAVEGRLTAKWRAERKAKGIATEPAAKLLQRILTERRKKWEAAQLKQYADAGKAPPKGWQAKYVEPAAPDASGLSELPDGWGWATAEQLSDEARAITYGVVKLGNEVPDGIPTLRSSNVRNLFLQLDGLKRIAPEIAGQYKRTFLVGDEILITVRGTLGGVVSAPENCAGYNVSREVAVMALVDTSMSKAIALFIASPPVQQWIKRNTKGIAYTGINIETLKEMPLPFLPKAEQTELVLQVEAKLSNITQAETEIKRSLERAARLRQAILKRAFEGRLV